MNDISAAERRLIAALERLDHSIDRAARRIAAPPVAVAPAVPVTPATPPEPAEVSPEVAALHDRQAATLEAMRVRLAEAHERLAETGEHAARLAAANDELARANRALIAAADQGGTDGGKAALAALEAEVEALHAARAAEIAQMGEILDALDRMLGVTTTARSHSTAGRALAPRRGKSAGTGPAKTESEPRSPIPAGPAPEATADPEPPRELTVVPDDDLPPTDDALAAAEDLPADPAPEEIDAARREATRDPALFGSVYDDAPDTDPDLDDEERR